MPGQFVAIHNDPSPQNPCALNKTMILFTVDGSWPDMPNKGTANSHWTLIGNRLTKVQGAGSNMLRYTIPFIPPDGVTTPIKAVTVGLTKEFSDFSAVSKRTFEKAGSTGSGSTIAATAMSPRQVCEAITDCVMCQSQVW